MFLFFKVGKGTPAFLYPPKILITFGPYKYTRNPMAIGSWLILIGEGFILHSFIYLIFLFFVQIPGYIMFIIKYEEPQLERRFGEKYLEYKKSVPRFISLKNFIKWFKDEKNN